MTLISMRYGYPTAYKYNCLGAGTLTLKKKIVNSWLWTNQEICNGNYTYTRAVGVKWSETKPSIGKMEKKSISEKRLKMKTIQLNIPDTVDLNDREAKMLLASRLYEKGKLTLGQAAELVGLSKRAFMEILGDYDVSIFNYPVSELDNDIKNAQDYSL